ncbi:MAG: OmpH family outer membrane protein [Planctomycetaceae bacterium]|nr:OmpH family outer membrane protein [Planctomycetaceae bacterium]
MKRTNLIPLVVVLALSFAGYITTAVNAQSAAATARPYQVAVVDIAQLIKNHPSFMAKQKELLEFSNAKEREFNERKMKISDREKTLNGLNLKPGTKEHDDAVAEITTGVTNLEKDVKIAQRKLITENSIILHTVYKEIREEIDFVAKQAQIAQVMDYRTIEATNPADPNAVAAMLEQNLIWYHENLDISQAIINRIYAKRNQTANVPDIKALRAQEKQAALSKKDGEQPRGNITAPSLGVNGTAINPAATTGIK